MSRIFFLSMCDVKVSLNIYFTEFALLVRFEDVVADSHALTTVLPILFKDCYKYCYSDSRKL